MVNVEACQGCGICVGECPAKAIEMVTYSDNQIFSELTFNRSKIMDFMLAIVAFCCENSAFRAADTAGAKQEGYPSNIKICRLPCSGKLEINYIEEAREL